MIHAGQFAIMKSEVQLPGYRSIQLNDGWILSYHDQLKLYISNDRHFILLGTAWQFVPKRDTPEHEIEKLSASSNISMEDVLAMEETWCGRYVLIYNDSILLDTGGLLSVFYSGAGVSSDCYLLAKAENLPPQIYSPEKGIVMNFMPGPLTHYPTIQRLLPSQTYHYKTQEVSSRRLLAQHVPKITDEKLLIETIVDQFGCSLRNMQRALGDKKLLIALTGGVDSRTLFALAKHTGIPFETYTLEYKGIYSDDISIPRIIADKTHTIHHYIGLEGKTFSDKLEQEYNEHVSGLIRDQDRIFYAYGQYQSLIREVGEAVLLRSGLWETVREYFGRVFNDSGPGFDFYDWFGIADDSREKESLEKFFDWIQTHPQSGLDIANVFYWEQRSGSWLSVIESGFDLIDYAYSFQPANCRYLFSLLMRFSREERITRTFQKRITAYACPEIINIPYGTNRIEGETATDVFLQKLRRGCHRLRSEGIIKTCKIYRSMLNDKKEKRKMNMIVSAREETKRTDSDT